MQNDAVAAWGKLKHLVVVVPSTSMLFPEVEDKDYLVPRGRILDVFMNAVQNLHLIFGPLGDIAVVIHRGDNLKVSERIFGSREVASISGGSSGPKQWTIYNRAEEENARPYVRKLVHEDSHPHE